MRIPPVFQRSGRRGGRAPYRESANEVVTARLLAAQLGQMIEKAEAADLNMLSYLLELARIEAERVTAGGPPASQV